MQTIAYNQIAAHIAKQAGVDVFKAQAIADKLWLSGDICPVDEECDEIDEDTMMLVPDCDFAALQ